MAWRGIRRRLYENVFAAVSWEFSCGSECNIRTGKAIFSRCLWSAYFSFRLACDFLKPDVAVFLKMSSIQWACVFMILYYSPDVLRWLRGDALELEQRERVRTSLPNAEASR